MPAQTHGRRTFGLVRDAQTQLELVIAQAKRLGGVKREGPSGIGLVFIRQDGKAVARVKYLPGPLPAHAVNRMRLGAEIFHQGVASAVPTQGGMADAVGKRHQRVTARLAGGGHGRGVGRAQHGLTVKPQARDTSAQSRFNCATEFAGSEV